MAAYREKSEIAKIRAQVGDKPASSAASPAAWIQFRCRYSCCMKPSAISSIASFVDHGLLRMNEAEEVVRLVQGALQSSPSCMSNASRACSSVNWPASPILRSSARTIGRLFIDVFEEEANKLGGADFLAQGTLYPDVIESVSFTGGPSVTIKSHHNVGGLPERMNMSAR